MVRGGGGAAELERESGYRTDIKRSPGVRRSAPRPLLCFSSTVRSVHTTGAKMHRKPFSPGSLRTADLLHLVPGGARGAGALVRVCPRADRGCSLQAPDAAPLRAAAARGEGALFGVEKIRMLRAPPRR